MEHFSEEELVEMKLNVIKSHMRQRKSSGSSSSSVTGLNMDSDESKLSCLIQMEYFNRIPNEIMIKVFSYMDYPEMLECAQVCKRWNNLIYDESNWKKLNLSDWKKNKGRLSILSKSKNNNCYFAFDCVKKDLKYNHG